MVRGRASSQVLLMSSLVLAAALAMWGCSRTEHAGCCPEPEEVLYSNSFESAADTTGWVANGSMWLVDEAAPDGGSQALSVDGGCIWPHAAYTLEAVQAGGYYTVRCWGRFGEGPGSVTLRVAGDYEKEIRLSVDSARWEQHCTSESIWCPRDQSLEVSISSGGFRQLGGVLVDRLEVFRVGP